VTDNIGKEDCAEGGRESGWTNTESQCSYDWLDRWGWEEGSGWFPAFVECLVFELVHIVVKICFIFSYLAHLVLCGVSRAGYLSIVWTIPGLTDFLWQRGQMASMGFHVITGKRS
jgi:hypothetical protein